MFNFTDKEVQKMKDLLFGIFQNFIVTPVVVTCAWNVIAHHANLPELTLVECAFIAWAVRLLFLPWIKRKS